MSDTPSPSSPAPVAEVPKAAEAAPPAWKVPSWITPAIALGVPLLLIFVLPPLSKSGLWDPFELNIADLGRRIAYRLLHAPRCFIDGADNTLPHLNDLGRPELPFTSIAVGFRLFGLHEWAGRLPLACWALVAIFSLYVSAARFFDRRTATYATLVLVTMPLFSVEARTMLGDIVGIAGFTMAMGGLGGLFFGRDPKTSPLYDLGFLLLGGFGLVVGYYSRGLFFGVGTPLAALALTWFVIRGSTEDFADDIMDALGGIALLGACYCAWKTWSAITEGDRKNLSMALGAVFKPPTKYPTFEFVIGNLGHSLAPWSAFAPFALGRLFVPPRVSDAFAFGRESRARVFVLLAVAVSIGAHAFLAAYTDMVPFFGVAALALACAVALRDFERGAHASIAVGVATMVLAGVLHHDFHNTPEKAYLAYGLVGPNFPDSFKDTSYLLWTLVLVAFAATALLTWLEDDSPRRPFDASRYLGYFRAIAEAWDGLLVLVYLAVVAGASLAGLAVYFGTKYNIPWLPTVSVMVRGAASHAWWITAVVPPFVVLLVAFGADLWLWTFNRSRPLSLGSFTRGFEPFEELIAALQGDSKDAKVPGALRDQSSDEQRIAAAVLVAPPLVIMPPVAVFVALRMGVHLKLPIALSLAVPSGVFLFLLLGLIGDLLRSRAAGLLAFGTTLAAVLSVAYYPALANQLSPKEVFDTYEHLHHQGEPLGLYGVGGRTAAYYAGGQPPAFSDPGTAYAWLTGGESRRFLALQASELPRLNALFRERSSPKQNLPVIDGRSSQILLASSSLMGAKDENPLDPMLPSAFPPPCPERGEAPKGPCITHPLDVNLEDKLQVVGWDLIGPQGERLRAISPGKKVKMRTYYRVLDRVGTDWEAFIHIDGAHKRHNGDHKPLQGKYPMSLWDKGDLVMDEYEFSLEPNFTSGNYTMFFGLFIGETRLKVKSGPSDNDNRIDGGVVLVR